MKMSLGERGASSRRLAVGAAAASLVLAGFAGAAFAVSGGGYSPYQQGCQPYSADYATPSGQTYPGCHDAAVNVESGGTTGGTPDDTNTKYAQVGLDQTPIDPNSQGTPTELSLGYPGSSGSPHAGCVAANTDGTGGQPAPSGSTAQPAGQSDSNTTYGCGSNPDGTGFAYYFDYYQYFCPIAATMGFACEAQSPTGGGYGQPPAQPQIDTGHQVASQPLIDNGLMVYFGMDDNTDNGEHDGLGPYSTNPRTGNPANAGAINGPSDGGAIMILLTPRGATNPPSQTHPEGIANASSGACADGICAEGTTQQQTVYHGCNPKDDSTGVKCDPGTPRNANVYDYAPGGNPANDPSVNQESPGCNSGSTASSSAAACGPGGMDAYRAATPANENAEPGVQVYTDPDPQRSPALQGTPGWPTPGAYVGTCGVYAGSPGTTGQIPGFAGQSVGGQQLTNAAGQVAVDPNPSAC